MIQSFGVLGGDFFINTKAQINYLDKDLILDIENYTIKLI